MTTIYDWVTVAIFAGLIVLFLDRSDQPTPPRDSLWQYLIAAGGCALVNWLGNSGYIIAALLAGSCLLAFILVILKPFAGRFR